MHAKHLCGFLEVSQSVDYTFSSHLGLTNCLIEVMHCQSALQQLHCCHFWGTDLISMIAKHGLKQSDLYDYCLHLLPL